MSLRQLNSSSDMYKLGFFSLGSSFGPALEQGMDEKAKFYWRRQMDAWKYGSGNDY
jgi:hypothetical protein